MRTTSIFIQSMQCTLLLMGILLFGSSMSLLANTEDPCVEDYGQLVCNSSIQLSVNENGEGLITPQMLLATSYPDYDDFVVEIITPGYSGNIIDCSMVGLTLDVMVTDTVSIPNNSCWTAVTVEDKLAPIISCDTVFLPCSVDPANLPPGIGPTSIYDNCTDSADMNVWYSETIINDDCMNSGYVRYIQRTYTVTDEQGMSASCMQHILWRKADLTQVEFPTDTVLACPSTDISPSVTGMPTIDGYNISDGICMLLATYSDSDASTCGAGSKTIRTWTVMDWCTGMSSMAQQLIEVTDDEAPVVSCPSDISITATTSACEASYTIPTPVVSDNCSSTSDITSYVNLNGVAVTPAQTVLLPAGTHTIQFIAEDCSRLFDTCEYEVTVIPIGPIAICNTPLNLDLDNSGTASLIADQVDNNSIANCGSIVSTEIDQTSFDCDDLGIVMVTLTVTDDNGLSSICMSTVNVRDLIPPIARCRNFTVDLGINGMASIDESDIDDGSTDNCGIQSYSLSKYNFDCDDIGTVNVVLTVTDVAGNTSTCNATVTVIGDNSVSITCPDDITIECDDDDSPASTGTATAMSNCNDGIAANFRDSIVDGSCDDESTIFRIWSASNNTSATARCIQRITIQDNTRPNITCPPDETVGCGESTAPAATGFASATDNCDTSPTITHSDDINIVNGDTVITRTWTAEDNCGNQRSCDQEITISSNSNLTIVCPANISEHADANCEADVTVPVPTVSNDCGTYTLTNDFNNTSNASGTYPLGVTTITWTVTNSVGSSTSCTMTVTVIDVTQPTITCPDTTFLNCDDPLFPLSQHGTPVVDDNCPNAGSGLSITYDSIVNLAGCGTGDVLVDYTVTDAAGNSSNCTHVIIITGTGASIDSTDVIYPPATMTIDDCISSIDINDLTAPYLDPNVNTCSQLSVSGEVNPISPATVGCFDFEVVWTLADSCTGDTWTYTQIIGVVDNDDPVVNPITAGGPWYADINCEADVSIPVLTYLDCNTATVTNNSPYANSNGANASGTYPGGTTPVTYTVTDICGNSTQYVFDVVVLDTIDPILVCKKSEFQINDNGILMINISEAITSATDNCGIVYVTFDLADLTDTVLTFDCDDVGMLLEQTVYAIDEAGNVDSCTSEIGIDDPNDFCPMNIVNIGGQLYTPLNEMLENAEVEISRTGAYRMQLSDDHGQYMFDELSENYNYRLDANKTDHPLKGITAYDISIIARQIAGLEAFDNPFQYAAADLDYDGQVDIRDVLILRKMLLGFPAPINENNCWQFFDAHYDLSTWDNVLASDITNYIMAFHHGHDMMEMDFIGVKKGDVDFSYFLEPFGATDADIQWQHEVENMGDENTYNLVVRNANTTAAGFIEIQLPVDVNIEALNIQPGAAISTQDLHLDVENRVLRVLWIEEAANSNAELIKLRTNTDNFEQIIDKADVTALVYNQAGEESQQNVIGLSVEQNHSNAASLELFQNNPNPFTELTIVQFYTHEACAYEFNVFNSMGLQLIQQEGTSTPGLNQITIDAKDLNQNQGLLYYEVKTSEATASRKMMMR